MAPHNNLLQFAVILSLTSSALAQAPASRYALILDDAPVAEKYTAEVLRSSPASSYRVQLRTRQLELKSALRSRKVTTLGSVETVLNAVFISATPDRLAELQQLPGVKSVVEMGFARRSMNRATQLVNAAAGWNALGGTDQAGAGIRIGILDSGIDQAHPAFQDSSLTAPAGFPVCARFDGNCAAYTNSKVIVARSYIRQIAAGDPTVSRPDDYTPRDRDGHGTAVASIAAAVSNGGSVVFNGVAPKAYLGSYKVFGSPGVNDVAPEDVVIAAINDAVADGMNVVNFSGGFVANSAPSTRPVAMAFENAVKAGVVVVVAAGDNGTDGQGYPAFNSIQTPADAPDVIAVGASTNSHSFLPTVSMVGPGIDLSLQQITAIPTDAPFGQPMHLAAVSGPLIDVTTLGNDGFACAALPAGSLLGAIALIEAGPPTNPCPVAVKAMAAQAAGAAGVIISTADQTALPSYVSGLYRAGLSGPVVVISNNDGVALKTFIDANPGRLATIDLGGTESDFSGYADLLTTYSSFGPSTGDSAIKPELVAPGGLDIELFLQGNFPLAFSGMYAAAQSYDPQGKVYSSNGYAAVDGTSFAAPLVAGAAALVKQQHPGFTPAQVKSALVNSAAGTIVSDDFGNPVDVEWLGNGKLDVGAAVNATVVADPATISFGSVANQTVSNAAKQVQVTNFGSSPVTLSLVIAPNTTGSGLTPTLSKTSLTLQPNASDTFTLSLRGSARPGPWSGTVNLQGSGVSLRIPYLFLTPDTSNPGNLLPEFLSKCGPYLDGMVGQDMGAFQFKLLDDVGLPIANQSVSFSVNPRNAATLQNASARTDSFGIAKVEVIAGSSPTQMTIAYNVLNSPFQFPQQSAFVIRAKPTITTGGVTGAGNSAPPSPVAPGSIIVINGTGLSDVTDQASTPTLPLNLDLTTVSFDVPNAGISVPAHLISVSPAQIVAQVPWELQGQSSAQVKVTINCSYGNVVTVPLQDYAPAWYESTPGTILAGDQNGGVISATNPAQHGQQITLFANGLGPVTNQPASGDPASTTTAAPTTTNPQLTIGDQQVPISTSTLVPGQTGRYQIVLTLPNSLAAGIYPVTITIGGQTSKPSNLPVQ
jgi:uncharacterized protein (TIGR03437 family)